MTARPIRSFTEMLGLLSKGRFSERLDEELSEAITRAYFSHVPAAQAVGSTPSMAAS